MVSASTIRNAGSRSGDEAAKTINDYVVTDMCAECD